jgi:hypothetical protein
MLRSKSIAYIEKVDLRNSIIMLVGFSKINKREDLNKRVG